MRSSLALVLFLFGCGQDICIRNSDCLSGEKCMASGVCGVPEDAGVEDGAVDAETTDKPVDASVDAAVDAAPDGSTDGGQ